MRITAIVPSAGRSQRLKSSVEKPYLLIGKKPVIFESRGKDLAALVSMDHFKLIEHVLRDMKNRMDFEAAERALSNPDNRERIPWDVLNNELGL